MDEEIKIVIAASVIVAIVVGGLITMCVKLAQNDSVERSKVQAMTVQQAREYRYKNCIIYSSVTKLPECEVLLK